MSWPPPRSPLRFVALLGALLAVLALIASLGTACHMTGGSPPLSRSIVPNPYD